MSASAADGRIVPAHAVIVLPIVEILREHDLASERAGSLEDRRVPVEIWKRCLDFAAASTKPTVVS